MKEGRRRGAQVLRNTGLGGIQQAITVLVSFLLLPYMLFRMGEIPYGVLLIVQMLSLNGLLTYAEFGLQSAVVREVAFLSGKSDEAGVRQVVATGFWTFVVIGLGLGALVLVVGDTVFFRVFRVPAEFMSEVRLGYVLYAATFWIHFPVRIIKGFLMALQDFPLLKIWESVERVAYGAALAAVVSVRPTIVAAIAAEVAVFALVALAFTVCVARRHIGRFTLAPGLVSFRRMGGVAHLGGHMFLSHLSFSLFYLEAPEVLAATFLGPVAVAHLAIVSKIPRAIKTFGSSANAALFPAVSSLQGREDRAPVRRLLTLGTRYAYAVLTPVVAFVLIYAEAILRVWVGDDYATLAWLMRGFVVWQFLAFLPFFLRAAFTAADEYRGLLVPSVLGNLIFLVIALVSIGATGLWAIVAALVAGTLMSIVAVLRVHRRHNALPLTDFMRESMLAPVLGGGLVATVVFNSLRLLDSTPDLLGLAVVFFVGSAICAVVFYWALMARKERSMLQQVLRSVAARA